MHFSEWAIDQEREVSPGNYARFVAYQDDWTLWRFETRNGVWRYAGKAAIGKLPLVPLGVAQALYGGLPNVTMLITDDVKAYFHGRHVEAKAEYRVVGDRFFTEAKYPLDIMSLDGKRIDVFVKSMPGTNAFSKRIEEQGIIDLAGLHSIVELGRNIT